MGAPRLQPATYADIEAAPPGSIAEIVAGELHVQPRPSAEHAGATTALGAEFHGPFQRGRGGPGGWWILYEPEIHVDGDVVVPDLCGYRRTRLPERPAGPFLALAPCWVCEVLSPGSLRHDRVTKRAMYARWGVPWMWLVDPIGRGLEAFRLDAGRWVLLGSWGDDDVARIEPFDAIELELGALWGLR